MVAENKPKRKGGPGAALVSLRWAKTTAEERKAVSEMMHEARRRKKAKRSKKAERLG